MSARNILIVPIGSSGDVHPFIGIGAALKARGHDVTILTNGYFRGLVEKVGLGFVELGTREEFEKLLTHPDAWHPRRALNFVADAAVRKVAPATVDALLRLNQPGRTVVVGSTLAVGTRVAQELAGIPTVTCHLAPSVFRTVYDMPRVPAMGLLKLFPRFVRKLAWKLVDKIADGAFGPPLNELRVARGLAPVRGIIDWWWHSPQRVIGLFPQWFGPMQPDWPKQTVLTGFPLFDEREVHPLSRDLEDFLAAGDKPVVFTPGSAMLQGARYFAAVADACRLSGRRGILLTRFPEQLPKSLPDGVRHFDYVPLSTLLPRAACMIYHGGIGTCAQTLAAGVPHLVMPMAHDQHDNSMRVQRLGVGAELPPKKFTARRLATKLDALLKDPAQPGRCAEVARQLKAENPIPRTCELIEAVI